MWKQLIPGHLSPPNWSECEAMLYGIKLSSVISVVEFHSRLMCWNMALLQWGGTCFCNSISDQNPWLQGYFLGDKIYRESLTNQNSNSTNGNTIEHYHEPVLFIILYRLKGILHTDNTLVTENAAHSSLLPYSSFLTAYCALALLIKLETNARWSSWASNCTFLKAFDSVAMYSFPPIW